MSLAGNPNGKFTVVRIPTAPIALAELFYRVQQRIEVGTWPDLEEQGDGKLDETQVELQEHVTLFLEDVSRFATAQRALLADPASADACPLCADSKALIGSDKWTDVAAAFGSGLWEQPPGNVFQAIEIAAWHLTARVLVYSANKELQAKELCAHGVATHKAPVLVVHVLTYDDRPHVWDLLVAAAGRCLLFVGFAHNSCFCCIRSPWRSRSCCPLRARRSSPRRRRRSPNSAGCLRASSKCKAKRSTCRLRISTTLGALESVPSWRMGSLWLRCCEKLKTQLQWCVLCPLRCCANPRSRRTSCRLRRLG